MDHHDGWPRLVPKGTRLHDLWTTGGMLRVEIAEGNTRPTCRSRRSSFLEWTRRTGCGPHLDREDPQPSFRFPFEPASSFDIQIRSGFTRSRRSALGIPAFSAALSFWRASTRSRGKEMGSRHFCQPRIEEGAGRSLWGLCHKASWSARHDIATTLCRPLFALSGTRGSGFRRYDTFFSFALKPVAGAGNRGLWCRSVILSVYYVICTRYYVEWKYSAVFGTKCTNQITRDSITLFDFPDFCRSPGIYFAEIHRCVLFISQGCDWSSVSGWSLES